MENDSELIGERIEIPRDGKASVKANLYVPDSIGDERSEYGLGVIKKISKELTQRYGKGYDRSNLYHCCYAGTVYRNVPGRMIKKQ